MEYCQILYSYILIFLYRNIKIQLNNNYINIYLYYNIRLKIKILKMKNQ